MLASGRQLASAIIISPQFPLNSNLGMQPRIVTMLGLNNITMSSGQNQDYISYSSLINAINDTLPLMQGSGDSHSQALREKRFSYIECNRSLLREILHDPEAIVDTTNGQSHDLNVTIHLIPLLYALEAAIQSPRSVIPLALTSHADTRVERDWRVVVSQMAIAVASASPALKIPEEFLEYLTTPDGNPSVLDLHGNPLSCKFSTTVFENVKIRTMASSGQPRTKVRAISAARGRMSSPAPLLQRRRSFAEPLTREEESCLTPPTCVQSPPSVIIEQHFSEFGEELEAKELAMMISSADAELAERFARIEANLAERREKFEKLLVEKRTEYAMRLREQRTKHERSLAEIRHKHELELQAIRDENDEQLGVESASRRSSLTGDPTLRIRRVSLIPTSTTSSAG